MEMNKTFKKSSQVTILISSVLIMVVIAFIATTNMEGIKIFIIQAGIWGLVISVFVYVLLGFTIIPTGPTTLLVGALYGPFIATLIATVGNTLAAVVIFYLGKTFGEAANLLEKKNKLPFGLAKLKVESPLFLIGVRLIPGSSPKIVAVLAGICHIPLFRYIWTTIIPFFVISAIFAFGGSELMNLFT